MKKFFEKIDWRFVATIFIILVAFQINNYFMRAEPLLQRKSFQDFPRFIDVWKTVNEYDIGEGSMAVLRVDDYLMRDYCNPQGEVINLYLGYFFNQREGKQVHSPRQCLAGSGWSIVEYKSVEIQLEDQKSFRVNYQLMSKGNLKKLYLWWFQGRGRAYADEYFNKLYLMLDSVLKRRTDGALVRVSMDVEKDKANVFKKEVKFISFINDKLADYIPE